MPEPVAPAGREGQVLTQTTSAGTKGFLFCDLRGYTAFIERSGDQAAAELLATYRDLVRGVIARHDGAEIRTEGDSVYVVFPAASGAVEAGLGIVAGAKERSTADRPIAVGVGIHAGETVATTEGLVGGAVNIAARVCAKAQAGEVLVTDTVRALTRTYLPYTYTSLGTQSLKGIAGGIPLYRVEAVPSSGRARLRRQLGARRGRLALLAGLAAVLLVGVAGVWAANRPTDCLVLPATTKDVVARIDPARGCVVATYPVGQRPVDIVAFADGVWVANERDWTVTRLDGATGRADRWVGVPGSPISMGLDPNGDLGVLAYDDLSGDVGGGRQLHHRVVFIGKDPAGSTLVRTLPGETRSISGDPLNLAAYGDLATSGGRSWVVSPRGTVLRVARTGILEVDIASVKPTRPAIVAAYGSTVWIGDEGAPAVYRIDGLAGRPEVVSLNGDSGTTAMAATADGVWLLRKDGSLTHVDSGSGSQRTIAVGGRPTGLAVGDGSVWLLDPDARTVVQVDAGSGVVLRTVSVGGLPRGVAIVGKDPWVTISAP